MEKLIKRVIVIGAIAIVAVILLFNCFTIVGPGHTGVVVTMGSVQEGVLSEGIHFKAPFVQSVENIDNRIQKLEVNTEAFQKTFKASAQYWQLTTE
jgi:regulator of protease activity HflC (stomatin/prohibitin superfamily)